MKVEVIVPEQYMGEVIGDLNSRRGRIEGMESHMGVQTIRVKVPLAAMFGYATVIRSLSQGRGTYNMEFSEYFEVPKNLADELIEKTKGSVAVSAGQEK